MGITMGNLIMTNVDVDCDGMGYSYQRVTVPTALINLIHENQRELIQWREKLAEIRSVERINRACETDNLTLLASEYDKCERWINRHSNKLSALNDVLDALLQETEQIFTTAEWYPLNREEAKRLVEGLVDEGGFNLDHWREYGYYHYFSAR